MHTPPEQNKALTVLGQFIGDIQQVMPETVKKNFLKAGNQLIFGMVDIPVAWLEQFTKRIRRKTEAMDMIQQGENAAIVKLFGQNPTLAQETLNFNSLKEYKAFFNRQKVMQGAMYELKNNPFAEDTDKEINEDWLEMFSKIVETRSEERIQLIFSKILAGEIQEPGIYSRATLQAVSLLEPETAKAFQYFCTSAITLKFDDDDNEGESYWIAHILEQQTQKLSKVLYDNENWIENLQEIGLVRFGTQRFEIEAEDFMECEIYFNKNRLANRMEDFFHHYFPIELHTYELTTAGYQLSHVVNSPLKEYSKRVAADYIKWLKDDCGVRFKKYQRKKTNS